MPSVPTVTCTVSVLAGSRLSMVVTSTSTVIADAGAGSAVSRNRAVSPSVTEAASAPMLILVGTATRNVQW